MSNNVKQMIGKVFTDVANALETGEFGDRVKVGITTLGSELGVDNMVKGAEMAQLRDSSIEVILIGPKVESKLTQVIVEKEEDLASKMEELLDSGEIGACVTMHYNFPIGVSTVGRMTTPGRGREMYLATTTGTSSKHRVEAMVKNGIYGIITAKAMGIEKPTIGVLNVDGSRLVETAFRELAENGYDVNFSESERADGGTVMRGNDLLTGTSDIMISDTLTGNILMKVFSSYTTGGSYESAGYGYGPGIGEDYERLVLILSRASGIPVVANAISYAGGLVKGDLKRIVKEEFKKAKDAGLKEILSELTKEAKKENAEEEVEAPPKETVTETINGIDIMELDDAVQVLWRNKIYAEAGMGCTGPIIMINENNLAEAKNILSKAGYDVCETDPC